MAAKTREETLEHPTTLMIYLLIRSRYPRDLGVREVQRELNLKSPSISSWHLEKLEQAGILVKSTLNRYTLSESEANKTNLNFPVKIPVHLIKGTFIPPFFLLGFLSTMTLVSFIFLFFNERLALFNSFSGLIISTIIAIYEFSKTVRHIKKSLKN